MTLRYINVSILFYSILFYSIVCYSILFYSILSVCAWLKVNFPSCVLRPTDTYSHHCCYQFSVQHWWCCYHASGVCLSVSVSVCLYVCLSVCVCVWFHHCCYQFSGHDSSKGEYSRIDIRKYSSTCRVVNISSRYNAYDVVLKSVFLRLGPVTCSPWHQGLGLEARRGQQIKSGSCLDGKGSRISRLFTTYYCYTSDRNVRLWLVQIASRGVS